MQDPINVMSNKERAEFTDKKIELKTQINELDDKIKSLDDTIEKVKLLKELQKNPEANKENINTERTTEADSPVKKANPQRNAMINKVRNTAIARQRPGNHRRQNQRKENHAWLRRLQGCAPNPVYPVDLIGVNN